MRRLLMFVFVLVLGATVAWAAGGYQATAYHTCTFSTGYPPTCENFTIPGGGAVNLYQDGSVWFFAPGDKKWTMTPPRTWDTSQAIQDDDSTWDVTVPQFSFTDVSTGTQVTISGSYEVFVSRGHYYTQTNPPGTLSVVVQ
jgi:hypothetical protein